MEHEHEHEAKKPATASDVKRVIRKRRSKHVHEEEMGLNIYPMMDMMTILLVFLIQQFASSSSTIVQSAELMIPYSNSKSEPSEAVPVQVARNEIVVDGKHVMDLRSGLVDPSHKQGGGTGFLIMPLMTEMEKHKKRLKAIAKMNPQRAFKGEAQIIADKRTPYRTLTEIVYTLGQTEFKTVRFVVLKQGGE